MGSAAPGPAGNVGGQTAPVLDEHGRLLGQQRVPATLEGYHRRRVHLNQPIPTLQVVDVRFQAGSQFGSGFKPRPKSDASIRQIPLAPQVVEAIRRRLPPGNVPPPCCSPGPAAAPASAAAPVTFRGERRLSAVSPVSGAAFVTAW